MGLTLDAIDRHELAGARARHDPEGSRPRPARAGAGSQAAGAATSAAGAAAGAAAALDDQYEHMLERLRRDLLAERERMGDLVDYLP